MFNVVVFLVSLGVRVIRAMCRRRADLVLENVALRQQVTALKKERPCPPLDDTERAFWVALRGSWPVWASRLFIVHADTVARWHRDRFRRYWAKISQRRQLLSRGPLPLGAEQGHTELESGHAPTVSYGESRRTAASRWIAPSIRVARGSLSQLGCSRYSVGRREVRPQHFPSRADHALQHVLEGGPGLESSPGQIMMMDRFIS